MALYKQWVILSKCAAEDGDQADSPLMVALPYEKTSSKKNSSTNSATKENVDSARKTRVFAEKTNNAEKKEPVLVEPIYPKIPAVQPKSSVHVIGDIIEDGAVITLSGA